MKCLMSFWLLIVWTASPWLAAAQDRPAAQDNKPAAAKAGTVPMEILRSKHIAVQIKVNGKGPYRVIFDTGSPVTLFSNKVAREAGLLTKDMPAGPSLFGARGQGTAKTVELGDIKVADMPVIIMDHPALKSAARFLGPLEGIVGFPFFSRYQATLDYQAKQMTFVPVDYRGSGMDLMQMMTVLMMEKNPKPTKKVHAPTTLWGFTVAKDKTDAEAGVVVREIVAGSAAAVAGLRRGDRLLELDCTWTESVEDCHRAVAGVTAGQAVPVRVKRGNQELNLTITPRAGL